MPEPDFNNPAALLFDNSPITCTKNSGGFPGYSPPDIRYSATKHPSEDENSTPQGYTCGSGTYPQEDIRKSKNEIYENNNH
jgi:hypothetical protein